MIRRILKLGSLPMKRVELTHDDDDEKCVLTLLAWQRQHGKFDLVKLDRDEIEEMRDALTRWLDETAA
jgi:hypothetical protein